MPIVVADHQPSIVENVFPTEIVAGLYKSHDYLSQEDLGKILGEKRFESFRTILSKNTVAMEGEEFFSPVVPLYYYKNLEEIQSDQNREALKSHGSSHGVIEGLRHPECRLLWRRIVEMAEDIVLYDNPLEDAKSIMNNSLLITSFLPVEEIRATFLRDWSRADNNRRQMLQEFEKKDIKEIYKENRWKAIYEWPYITASKSVTVLKTIGFSKKDIGDLIRKCDLAASAFELIASRQDWTDEDDKLISNLPYFVSILRNSEKIKNKDKTINEVFTSTKNIECFQLSSTIYQPILELEDWAELEKQSLNVWKAWKVKNIIDGIVEGDLALATLHYLADYIATSLIVVESSIGWKYNLLIPKITKYHNDIRRIVTKIKHLLLQTNPTFTTYDIDPTKGDKINIFDVEFTFPRIIPSQDSTGRIKDLLEDEENFCREIEKELEQYGKKINLNDKVDSVIKMTPGF